MADQFRFAAFISYSSKDAAFARRLHRALESYRIPTSIGSFDLSQAKKTNRVYPVFRDREELPTGDLSEQIETALKASRALIVVCSTHAANSKWVNKEIEVFVNAGRSDRIFAVVADTVPSVIEVQSCLPAALRAADSDEPLAADARRGADGFRSAWIKLVAGLIGVNSGQLRDRDDARRRAGLVTAGALSMALALAFAGVYTQRDALNQQYFKYTRYTPFAQTLEALQAAPHGETFQDCRSGSKDCPVMVIIPEGQFVMGSDGNDQEGAGGESPRRTISVERFAVSQTEITFDDWSACVAGGGCDNAAEPSDAGWGRGRRPVINVSWENAQEYVRWLSHMTGHEYRLLSEAEWEYAARAQTNLDAPQTQYGWGNDDPACDPALPNGAEHGVCNRGMTAPVGTYRANAFGLFDMHGNVWEWVQDCFAPYSAAVTSSAAIGPADATECEERVMRGGSRGASLQELRSAARRGKDPHNRTGGLGFRIARTL